MPVIYKFASDGTKGLFAFSGDPAGGKLPERHGPWSSTGKVQPHEAIPHRLNRESIVQAIDDHGYQMWRLKKTSKEA